ncbi:condensation domain-containing protein [Streptomyces tendae]|uniref:condensation domain-containing protein n=1 Tax=Streptomyces tendae TaxID=1932 RepID=UPI0024926C8B|nr:condensation domain-containing protein [Streptomyces tendae]
MSIAERGTLRSGLTAAQRRLWMSEQINPSSDGYLIRSCVRMEPGADPDLLEAALGDVVDAHPSFRTEFCWDDEGSPAQVVRERVPPQVERVATGSDEADGTGAWTPPPFDLERAPLIAFRIVCHADLATRLDVVGHHIVFDGWSLGIFVADLGRAYDARVKGDRADLTGRPGMAEFSDAEADWLRRPEGAGRVAELADVLRGAPELVAIPTDRPRRTDAQGTSPTGAGLHFTLPWDLSEDVTAFVASRRVTLNMVGLAAFATVVGHWSGTSDVVVGSAFAGRTSLRAEQCVGCFINVVPLRVSVDSGATFAELLDHVRDRVIFGTEHQDVPFDRLLEELRPARSPQYDPLVQVAFGVQNTEPAEYRGGVRMVGEPAPDDDAEARLDLTLWLEESPEGLKALWTYRQDLFDRATIAGVNQWFFRVLGQASADPDVPLSSLTRD